MLRPRVLDILVWSLFVSSWLVPSSGCDLADTGGVPVWRALVAADGWQPSGPGGDPFPDHRPGEIECSPLAWHGELGGLEIETRYCNYLLLTQPLLEDIESGELVRIRAWWQPLTSTEPAVAHVAVAAGDAVIWEEHVAIPGRADARDLEIAAPAPAPRGASVALHLHNHGYNTWMFYELSILKHE